MASITFSSSFPSWPYCFSRRACSREGIISRLSIRLYSFSCSSYDRYDNSTAGRERAMAGTRTPYCLMLSTISVMFSSSSTLKGWSLKGNSSFKRISWMVSPMLPVEPASNSWSSGGIRMFLALLFMPAPPW